MTDPKVPDQIAKRRPDIAQLFGESGAGVECSCQTESREVGSGSLEPGAGNWVGRSLTPGRSAVVTGPTGGPAPTGHEQTSWTVERTQYATRSAIQNMCVDLGRCDVRMPKQFLNRTNIVAGLQQMRRK